MPAEQEVLNEALGACCAEAYGHPLARWLLGDSFHPGGLGLTTRLARLAGVGPGDWVLDVGSGLGASAVHLAGTTGCRVLGVTLEQEGVAAGVALAGSRGLQERVAFVQGDFLVEGLIGGPHDVALMECVLSLQPDKPAALRRLYGALGPGGRLALSDVTVEGSMPAELHGIMAMVGCLGGALGLEEYRALVEEEGFTVEHAESLPQVASAFVGDMAGKLLLAEAAVKLGKFGIGAGLLDRAKELLVQAKRLVAEGSLGYGLLVARKSPA